LDALHDAARRAPLGPQTGRTPGLQIARTPGARAQTRRGGSGGALAPRARRWLGRALALLALGLLGADDLRAQEAPRAIRVVVAVLPFEVHSARSLGYLEESLADLLATRLEASGRIEVVEALTVREALVAYPGERSEQRVRRLAAQLKAEWVVVGSLTELAGQYSLDVRVTPAGSRFSSTALSFAAGGDDELLDRIDELAGRVLTLVTGGAEQLRVAALEIAGVQDRAALLRVVSLRAGDPYDADAVQADLERLRALPGIARADVDMQTGDEGVSLVFRVVPTGALMSPADAQRASGAIAEVRVRGNRRIEEGAILARISSRAGEPFRTARLPGDLRDIHRLGFFRNVRVFSDQGPAGRVLIFEVEENPVVRQVTITGNDKIDGEKIRDNLTLTTGSTLDLPLLFENKQRIEAIYRAEGYYLARVQHEIEDLTTGSVAINFVVDEGKKLRLRKVEFEGNEAFSDAELKEAFKTRTWRWHSPVTRFFNKAGTYSEPIFHQDLRTVSDLYFDNGYIQAEVSDPEVTPSEKGLSVLVRIAEGPQFRVRDVDASGDRTVDVEDMRRSLALRAEDIFSRSSLNDDVERLEHRYTDRGFYAAEVKPRTRVDEGENRVDVTFEVEKGPLFFLREIEVTGNSQTVDPVVRREMRMVEGELYSERADGLFLPRQIRGLRIHQSVQPVRARLRRFPLGRYRRPQQALLHQIQRSLFSRYDLRLQRPDFSHQCGVHQQLQCDHQRRAVCALASARQCRLHPGLFAIRLDQPRSDGSQRRRQHRQLCCAAAQAVPFRQSVHQPGRPARAARYAQRPHQPHCRHDHRQLAGFRRSGWLHQVCAPGEPGHLVSEQPALGSRLAALQVFGPLGFRRALRLGRPLQQGGKFSHGHRPVYGFDGGADGCSAPRGNRYGYRAAAHRALLPRRPRRIPVARLRSALCGPAPRQGAPRGGQRN